MSKEAIQQIQDCIDRLLHHQEDAAMYGALQDADKATQMLNNIVKGYDHEYRKGYHDAVMMLKENLLTPDLCKTVMDCVKVCDQLLEYEAF